MKWAPWAIAVAATLGLFYYWTAVGRQEERAKQSAVVLSATRDSLGEARQHAATVLTRVDTLWRVRTITLARVDTLRVKGDSFAVIAHTLGSDTALACRPILLAYQARTSECDQLRVAVRQDSAVVDALRLQVQRDTATFRDLALQLSTVSKPYTCRILPFLPCLSRRTSFLVGLLGGGLLTWRVTR